MVKTSQSRRCKFDASGQPCPFLRKGGCKFVHTPNSMPAVSQSRRCNFDASGQPCPFLQQGGCKFVHTTNSVPPVRPGPAPSAPPQKFMVQGLSVVQRPADQTSQVGSKPSGKVCWQWSTTGKCSYAAQCMFDHPSAQVCLQWSAKRRCWRGAQCKFSASHC